MHNLIVVLSQPNYTLIKILFRKHYNFSFEIFMYIFTNKSFTKLRFHPCFLRSALCIYCRYWYLICNLCTYIGFKAYISSYQSLYYVVWTKWIQIDTLIFIQTAISEGFLLTFPADVNIMQWFQQTNVNHVLNLCILNCFKTLQWCCLFCIPPPIWRLLLLPSF